jgi:hypothetical protein
MLQRNKGYTLLFAVLVSSIVLSVGISILTISKKEFQLAASARDSTSAFYAADSGLECAVYYNDRGEFSTSTPIDLNDISCGGYTPIVFSEQGDSEDSTIIHTQLGDSGSCAIVSIDKYYVNGISQTRIISRGYNTGWKSGDGCVDLSSPRRVERALRFTY